MTTTLVKSVFNYLRVIVLIRIFKTGNVSRGGGKFAAAVLEIVHGTTEAVGVIVGSSA